MTIHSEHPFLPPDDERHALRRLRGRLAAPVTVWTAGVGASRVGWTVSSVLLADGEPPQALGLLDEDSDLVESLGETLVVNVLASSHRFLADAFAGLAPAPGGPFTLAEWTDTEWGPALNGAAGWAGVRVTGEQPERRLGWSTVIEGVVEHVSVGESDPLVHLRGRYRD